MTEFTVATANTYQAKMLHDIDGLKPFAESGTDILLMQEVLGLNHSEIEDRLGKDGFALTYCDVRSGLTIAIHDKSPLSLITNSQRTNVIQPMPMLARVALSSGIPLSKRLRERSMISVQLETESQHKMTVATSHPIVFIRAISRARQINKISQILADDSFNGSLVLGADMNHYPAPRKVDNAMHTSLGFTAVGLNEPTWKVTGSKHQWAAHAGSVILRRPITSFDAQLDALLYRQLTLVSSSVIDIASDHRAIVARMLIT